MSKSATFKHQPLKAGAISWQLAQTFWVGGLWLLHFVMLPALDKIGLAPLLIEEIANLLRPLLVGFTAFCALLQLLVLWQAERPVGIWRDTRGQLLLAVLAMAAVYFAVRAVAPEALRWLLFNYLVLALCGILLVLQPPPGQGR
ncbi:DUF4149 domain-containing protein [Zestomonas carbonaria]|uniref:DUF4149 domain-containing protein n=1 Tax=Zestomonas carbonaria TaxID=2762745 RepID=A0A7U7I862_9GAMM|nr:DUF4149 domain-containing protein [Pseudomonas carbonaria]CAD5106989.1 hypothetical protein PSEWESI4_01259 [Pseudomonas carbonaria]